LSEPERIIINIDDDYRRRVTGICQKVIDVLLHNCDGPVEAFFILHCCTEAISKEFNIESAETLEYPTTLKQ